MTIHKEDFWKNVKAFKEKQQMNLYQVSDNSGIDQSDISRYLNNKGNPTFDNLMKLITGMGGKLIVIIDDRAVIK